MSEQRVVAITGASSGIGRATAHELSRRGDALLARTRNIAAGVTLTGMFALLAMNHRRSPR